MKQTVNVYDFRKAFFDYDRGDNFSLLALTALFEYLEQLEEDIGEEMDLDVIALCCDFTEWDSVYDYNSYYDTEYKDLDELSEAVTAIPVPRTDRFITQDF